MKKTLIFGYGNVGRRDDGLAHFFIEKVEKWAKEESLDHLFFDENFQLNIEDAETISNYDLVLFVDASMQITEPFMLERISADDSKIEFTMHAVSPAFVVDLCQKMFDNTPEAYLLHLNGIEWGVGEGLSTVAKDNLEKAFDELKPSLTKGRLDLEIA